MLIDLAWQATDDLVREQLAMLDRLADEIALDPDDRRRALNLDESTWVAWQRFQAGGLLPANPRLPNMLRRVSETAFNLSIALDFRSRPACDAYSHGTASR
jgi:hypothetical protein